MNDSLVVYDTVQPRKLSTAVAKITGEVLRDKGTEVDPLLVNYVDCLFFSVSVGA